jgi:gliding motility-associated-like protein
MKKILLICLIFFMVLPCKAAHIIGGEMLYEYKGPGLSPNTSLYTITLKLFRDQLTTGAAMPIDVFIGIFDNDNNLQYPGPNQFYDVDKSSELPVVVDPFPPCISNAPTLNYHVGIFIKDVTLPNNSKGYTATYQTCCRVNPLANVFNAPGVGGTGSTYSCKIPAVPDKSPYFSTSIDAICRLKRFTLRFNAMDDDRDSLVYSFAPAYNGGATQNAANVNPNPPPYFSVEYTSGFISDTPLGESATIDPHTGIISGIAPDVGKYVVCVSVISYRNGIFINEHRKDFIVNVTDCDFAGVQLDPKPVSCDGFSVDFINDNNSPQNQTFYWEFGDPASGASDTSTLQTPTHVYTDTGAFVYKLVINRGQQCSDSATQIRKVYPGFFTGFKSTGRCVNAAIRFTDTTKSKYGKVDSWRWDFGDPSVTNDTSITQNPVYTYATIGNYPVQMVVGNSKGCVKTVTDTVSIIDKPVFDITNDTLICSIDTLQLTAYGTGSISWSPGYNISNQSSFTPLVSPKVTTTYFATLTETPGCFSTESVKVNVVSRVTLNAGNDSTICLTDSIRLNTISDGLHYVWTPAAALNMDTAKNPLAAPHSNTTFHVIASIGKCKTAGDVTIRVVPYPNAKASEDTTICFPRSYQLHATGGSSYLWSPVSFLDNPNIPDPVTTPPQSIRYIVAVKDILGCPKPAFDSVLILVEKIVADAGPRDTSIVVNQPLQLFGTDAQTGAEVFAWKPSTGLNNPNIPNPVAVISDNEQYVLKAQSATGCSATDTIDVIVFKVTPGLYVPNAFTPNGDGKNDIFRPIPIGMKSIKYFKVYNRRGQLIFSNSAQNENERLGWDGTFKGAAQDADVYVWIVEGVDYQDKAIFQKGTVTLVR